MEFANSKMSLITWGDHLKLFTKLEAVNNQIDAIHRCNRYTNCYLLSTLIMDFGVIPWGRAVLLDSRKK